jgi:hypothetical protein
MSDGPHSQSAGVWPDWRVSLCPRASSGYVAVRCILTIRRERARQRGQRSSSMYGANTRTLSPQRGQFMYDTPRLPFRLPI